MHAQLEALLQLQAEDDVVDAIAARLDDVAPRLAALDAERARAARQLEQTLGQLQTAERKQREMAQLVDEHRQRQERNVAQFDLVKKMREAEAAAAQVESGRKLLMEGERDLREMGEKVEAIRHAAEAQRELLSEFDATQQDKRAEIERDRAALDAELSAARKKREKKAGQVPDVDAHRLRQDARPPPHPGRVPGRLRRLQRLRYVDPRAAREADGAQGDARGV